MPNTRARINLPLLFAPRQYGLTQQHKHLKEMKGITGIENAPIFCPVVDDFLQRNAGHSAAVRGADKLFFKRNRRHLQSEISGSVVTFCDKSDNDSFLCAGARSGTDGMKISVYGNDERILLTAVYDNLGKGASGAALEKSEPCHGQGQGFRT